MYDEYRQQVPADDWNLGKMLPFVLFFFDCAANVKLSINVAVGLSACVQRRKFTMGGAAQKDDETWLIYISPVLEGII